MINILIYGDRGYIGGLLKKYFLNIDNINIIKSKYNKITCESEIVDDILSLKPDRVISTIGLTHSKDSNSTLFLNDDKFLKDNIELNLFIHILISNVCLKNNIHFTYIGTGCIYSSRNENFIFDEDDTPNFYKNKYSLIKCYTDKILSLNKDKLLILRIRQCLNDDNNSRNFLNKFLKFKKVSDIPNSFTVIPSIFPIIVDMIISKKKGIFNTVNKNAISVKDIVEIFNKKDVEVIDKDILYNKYSNNILSTKNMEKYYFVEDIKESLIKIKKNYYDKIK